MLGLGGREREDELINLAVVQIFAMSFQAQGRRVYQSARPFLRAPCQHMRHDVKLPAPASLDLFDKASGAVSWGQCIDNNFGVRRGNLFCQLTHAQDLKQLGRVVSRLRDFSRGSGNQSKGGAGALPIIWPRLGRIAQSVECIWRFPLGQIGHYMPIRCHKDHPRAWVAWLS